MPRLFHSEVTMHAFVLTSLITSALAAVLHLITLAISGNNRVFNVVSFVFAAAWAGWAAVLLFR